VNQFYQENNSLFQKTKANIKIGENLKTQKWGLRSIAGETLIGSTTNFSSLE
jgi:hypothetical protein